MRTFPPPYATWSKSIVFGALALPLLLAGCLSNDSESSESFQDQDDELVTENANDKIAFDFFVGKGLTPVQAAGIVGNLDQESGMDPTIKQYGGGPGRGIAQWSAGGRWDKSYHDNAVWYAGQKGESVYSLKFQLEFIWYELTTYGYGFSKLKAATTIAAAVDAFQDLFEICGQCASSNRIAHAQAALAKFGSDSSPPAAHGGSGSLAGDLAAEPVVGHNADGRLEVFAVGAKGNMETAFQDEPNGGWSGWFSLGGNLEGRPAVANNQDGRIEIFARNAGGTMEHAWQDAPNGKIGNFTALGSGTWTSDPAVARNQDGRIEVFAVGSDGAVHHAAQTAANGGWGSWASLGTAGGGLSEPRAILAHDGTLRAFAVGKDGATYMAVQGSGSWGAWKSLGGTGTSNATVTKNADGRLEVFIRGTDGALWHQWEESLNGAWSGWHSLGGGVHSPFAVNDADGRIEVFVRGNNTGPLYRIAQTAPNGGWTGWTGMGGTMAGGAAAARNADGRLEVFFRATDGSVHHAWEGAPEKW